MTSIEKARLLRQHQTPTEAILWEQLRARRLAGFKFRRQYVIEQYIADFVCVEAKLIVELDGEYHAEVEQAAYDAVRTQFLQALDFRVLRFWNWEVEKDLGMVLEEIERQLTPSPSPHAERGNEEVLFNL